MSDTEKITALPPVANNALRMVFPVLGLLAFVLAACSNDDGSSDTAACSASPQTMAALSEAATGDMAALNIRDEPEPVGEMRFQDAEGSPAALADYRGRTVLLNLWATWCAPCRAEMPAFDRLEADLGSEKFAVVPVSVDHGEATKPKKFFAETNVKSLPFYHDGTMAVFNTMKKRGYTIGLPLTLLIDAKGCILASLAGPAEWAGEDARAVVKIAVGE